MLEVRKMNPLFMFQVAVIKAVYILVVFAVVALIQISISHKISNRCLEIKR